LKGEGWGEGESKDIAIIYVPPSTRGGELFTKSLIFNLTSYFTVDCYSLNLVFLSFTIDY